MHDNHFTTEHYFKLGLQSSFKNVGKYRKIVDKFQHIDTYKLKYDTSKWTFKCYNRTIFEKIREHYGINSNIYMESLCNENMIMGKTYPKSGAKFWKTSNNKYIIKTITKSECKFLRSILKKYSNYIQNNDTYITKIFGMYRIVLPHLDYRFIIMNNIFEHSLKMDNIFDLKGTTEERFTKNEEQEVELKDMNFIERKFSFTFDEDDYNKFLSTIRNDSTFLKNLNIMDYSLLVGVLKYKKLEDVPKNLLNHHNVKINISEIEIKLYIFGIIDILQEWTLWKKCCRIYKKCYYHICCCNCLIEIDSEKPCIYHKRFIHFITRNTNLSSFNKKQSSSEVLFDIDLNV